MNIHRQPLPPAAPHPTAPSEASAAVLQSMDRCTKCGICQAYCPVAAVTNQFPGPKTSGPQAARFRVIDPVKEVSPALCNGCGICTSVCPNGVAITDIIALAKMDMVGGGSDLPLGQKILNRPALIGRIGAVLPGLANAVLGNRMLRTLGERLTGIHRNAPVPKVRGKVFRRWLAQRRQPEGPAITYFTGCAIEHYDPDVGMAVVETLNHLGYRVAAPTDLCCGLAMLSSGEKSAADRQARSLIEALEPSASDEIPIISTSTSCSLTLKSKYAAYLDMSDATARAVASSVFDICEFLRDRASDELSNKLHPVAKRVLYHAPCQLRGHGMGYPAVELLKLVPGLEVILSRADCCGIGGTYGYDRNRFEISRAIGATLQDQVHEQDPDFVICDSETCRWNISAVTGVPCHHPVEIIAASLADRDISASHQGATT